MKLSRRLMAGVVLSGMLVTAGLADEPTKEDIEKAEGTSAVLSELAIAGELVAFGRDAKNPESLVIAGGILIRANKALGGKVTPIEVGAKLVPLDQQANDLFDEARAMVTDKARSASLEVLIKSAQDFPRGSDAESRGHVGGARQITRNIAPGATETIQLAYVGGMPAAVSMTSSGPAKIQFDLTHGANNLVSVKGHTAYYTWVPPRDKDAQRKFVVTMTNTGKKPTTFTLTTN